MPSVPPGWKSTGRCGRQSSLRPWSAPCIWRTSICLPGELRCWRIWATSTANELYDPAGAGENAASAILEGLDQLAGQCVHLIVVSNEVFSGGADYAGDTGRYLKALAQVNNALAARADHVVRVVCGIPVYYKGVEK